MCTYRENGSACPLSLVDNQIVVSVIYRHQIAFLPLQGTIQARGGYCCSLRHGERTNAFTLFNHGCIACLPCTCSCRPRHTPQPLRTCSAPPRGRGRHQQSHRQSDTMAAAAQGVQGVTRDRVSQWQCYRTNTVTEPQRHANHSFKRRVTNKRHRIVESTSNCKGSHSCNRVSFLSLQFCSHRLQTLSTGWMDMRVV